MDSLSELRKNLHRLESQIGYTFNDSDLLMMACSHSSFVNENPRKIKEHNERLEFLGDSVLGMVVSHYLFQHYKDPEGVLSQMKARLVDAHACLKYVEDLEVEEFLLLGKGESLRLERGRLKLLSNFFEALVGALFLDQGFDAARLLIVNRLEASMEQILKAPEINYKARLQEKTQSDYRQKPEYVLTHQEGPEHNKQFVVEVYLNEKKLGQGSGPSKKGAQQMAARQALETLEEA